MEKDVKYAKQREWEQNNPDKVKEIRKRAQRKYYLKNRENLLININIRNHARTTEQRRAYHQKYIYGISKDDFDILFEKQSGRCAICYNTLVFGRRKDGLTVDHDHKTGKVRGLLCASCNMGLGKFKDSITLLLQTVAYLELQNE